MTRDKDLKDVVRDRSAKTGESYAAARRQLQAQTSTAAQGDSGLEFTREQLAVWIHGFWNEFRPSLKGLTDDEYVWEPVTGCPNIRPLPDGGFAVDGQFPIQGAASIAQRASWVALQIRIGASHHFGDKSLLAFPPVPGTAKDGIALLDRAVAEWRDGVAHCDPQRLLKPSENKFPGRIDGRFPLLQTILWHHQLLVQCCSQISTTRDLYIAHHSAIVGN